MSNPRQITIEELENSKNQEVQKLKKKNWISSFDKDPEDMEDGFIMDMSRASGLINGKSLVTALENHPSSTERLSIIRNMANTEYFQTSEVTVDEEFNKQFDHLHKSWGYVANVLRGVILSSIRAGNENLLVKMGHSSDIRFEKPNIYVDVTYHDIFTVHTKTLETTPLPGKVTSRFFLAPDGFKLTSVTVEPGTSLLSDLCMKESIPIHSKPLKTAPNHKVEPTAVHEPFSSHHLIPSSVVMAYHLITNADWGKWKPTFGFSRQDKSPDPKSENATNNTPDETKRPSGFK